MNLIHPHPPPNRFGDAKHTAKLDQQVILAKDRGDKDDEAYAKRELTKLAKRQPGQRKIVK